MKPVIISGDVIGEDDLRQFIADTERLTGSKIVLKPQWLVHSESTHVLDALAMLFAMPAPAPDELVVAKAKKGRGKSNRRSALVTVTKPVLAKSSFKLAPTPPQEIASWCLMNGDAIVERLTVGEKNRRLVEGLFDEGTILHHPKAGKQVVTGPKGSGQGMKPLEARDGRATD